MSIAASRRDFLMSAGALIGALSLYGCETTPNPSPTPPVMPPTPSPAPVASAFPMIVDASARIDASKAKALKAQGVRTVFRYYCQLPPSIPGKDLQPEEAKIILGEGLSLGVVFQHYNNCFRTFENRWGKEDAEQALKMAEAIGQPKDSAIYFGVDGDWPWASLSDAIVAYFEDVNRVFEGTGFDVGIYSNGCTCNLIRTRKLAKYFWLSGS
ncbi:MAG: glycoside hydrolase domain-containing protein, partial [Caulobacterales bacterium]